MKITTKTFFGDFLHIADTFEISEAQMDEMFTKVKKYPIKKEFDVPFDDLLFEQLCDLQSIKTAGDLFVKPFSIVLGINTSQLLKYKAVDCLRFIIHTTDELKRITGLFSEIEYQPTPEELQAGIKDMKGDFFDTADWYAQRMGIKDHDEVFKTKWIRIYRVMKRDFNSNEFERKLRKVIERKNKA